MVTATITRSAVTAPDAASSSAPERLLWVVHSPDGPAVNRGVHLDRELVVFGRDVDDLSGRIADLRMSRTHFRIVFDVRSGCHRAGDAGSRNGFFLNGEVVRTAKLTPGDVLRAGDTLFVYGEPDKLGQIEQDLNRLARSELTALIVGETGSGKERIARALHESSGRPGRFIAINCAALPKELIGAELFGHTRGAFSGAQQARDGLFVAADEGTLLLDEVADLPLELQGVLLRMLQERSVRPIGADHDVRADVRIIAATHVDLERSVEEGTFRGDLYARLAQRRNAKHELRERRQQILRLARELAGVELTMELEVAEALLRYDWPFNVRELESLIAAFLALRGKGSLDLAFLSTHCPKLATGAPRSLSTPPNQDAMSRSVLEQVLRKHRGNVSAAAKELNRRRGQVYRWLKAAGLKPERFR